MPQENGLIDEQEITVDFDITEDINIELGKVYESGGSGLEETVITISLNSYTVIE